MFYVNGLEYLGRDVKIKGKTMKGVEAKRFVTLKKTNTKPTRDEVLSLAKARKGVKKVWVMEMIGNKWKKVMNVINL
ncbi:MAG: hypothetical protein ABH874_04420 [Methanobacteriota archaeon]|jgi:FAD synthase